MLPGAMRLDGTEEDAAAEAAREVIRSKRLYRYGAGPPGAQRTQVARLERAFTARTGADHALGVNSGTSALVCAMRGLGIGPGDEVVVPGYTWFSTASAVLAVGAVPVFAEVDDTLTLDPESARERLADRSAAIVAVHMRGAPARMDALRELADDRGVCLIEDVAQANGGSFAGRPLGGIGDAGTFSFGMHKAITAGEGGMLVTSRPEVHRRAAMYHDAASPPHIGVGAEEWLPGVNLRLSELQGAVLGVQLDRLDGLVGEMRERRRRLRARVAAELSGSAYRLRAEHDPAGDTGLALILYAPDLEAAAVDVAALADDNVPASRLYQDGRELPYDFIDLHAYPAWSPILAQRTWSERGGPWRWHPHEIDYDPGDLPRTMDLLRRAIHIDVSPELTLAQVDAIGDALAAVVRSPGRS